MKIQIEEKNLQFVTVCTVPVTEWSLTAALQSSTLAECQGTYRSCVEPANKTCRNICKLDFCESWYIKVLRMSVASFKANWWRDPDFFHFCMNHIPVNKKKSIIFEKLFVFIQTILLEFLYLADFVYNLFSVDQLRFHSNNFAFTSSILLENFEISTLNQL